MKKKAAPNKKNGPRKKNAAPKKQSTFSEKEEQRKQQLKDGTKSLKLWLKEKCIIVKWHKSDNHYKTFSCFPEAQTSQSKAKKEAEMESSGTQNH